MTSPPECAKCLKPHWRFTTCEAAKTLKPKPGPHRTVATVEGERPWGDRLTTVKRTASNAFYSLEKKSPHGGSVNYPPGTAPPGTKEGTDGS